MTMSTEYYLFLSFFYIFFFFCLTFIRYEKAQALIMDQPKASLNLTWAYHESLF